LKNVEGKAHVVCEEIGLQFRITTLFPFTGQIFAHDRKRVPGLRRAETQYHMQIIVVFEQNDGKSTIQSFIAQCQHQKVQYQKSTIPKRIEEALEELRLVPTKLEQKAPIPECIMRIVKEEDHGHEGDGVEVDMVDLGQPMRIEWSLVPESDAYGFHVRNCTVRDRVSGEEHLVIDERGCSTDINIFGHPHYDTYHDVARVHWHAFKVPDNSQLSIRCSFEICSDISDSTSGITSCDSVQRISTFLDILITIHITMWHECIGMHSNQLSIRCSFEICSDISDSTSGITSCDSIPSPPFCPDLITSPSNSILFDYDGNLIRKRSISDAVHQQVHTDICLGDMNDKYCNSDELRASREKHLRMISTSERICVSRIWLSVCTGLSAWTTLLAIGVHGYCRSRRRRHLMKTTMQGCGLQRLSRNNDRCDATHNHRHSKFEITQTTTHL
uniref:ZP domain-containing protein n=1 Tax=Ascaris lumbricoides TaxID=6252 RepID=A0A0M3IIN8_ASCLU